MRIVNNFTENHLMTIKSISQDCDEMIFVSPFLFNDFNDFFDEIIHDGIKKVTLLTTLKNDIEDVFNKNNSLVSFVDCLTDKKINWKLHINNKLHGKIYLFKKDNEPYYAIITSANLTDSGMKRNIEWGCLVDDKILLSTIENQITSSIDYTLSSEDSIIKLMLEAEKYSKEYEKIKNSKNNIKCKIDEIFERHLGITPEENINYFIKPIGHTEHKIWDGDFSKEDELYFSKRRPNAVNIGDILICYAVGPAKLLSYFKVLSEPKHTGNDKDRWPWYVKTQNLSPEFGKVWYNYELTLSMLQEAFLNEYPNEPVSYIGGKTLGALQWGADKIRLNDKFGKYLIEQIKIKNV